MRLTIVIEGGLVQGVVADTPEEAAQLNATLQIRVRDWDQEDEDGSAPGLPYEFDLTQIHPDQWDTPPEKG